MNYIASEKQKAILGLAAQKTYYKAACSEQLLNQKIMSDNVHASLQSSMVQISQSSNSSSRTEKISSDFEVFISYRTNPDQELAVALKELIEGSIEP
ncbi:hypothetical protein [Nostoc sp. LPT]|uniref:hypothetical protein n=1 Tax=Nostoc sp. LPT TaxID=2815387 RepID=UPI001D798C09|nr:hypothetical protein [Nostoc sp. LPT]MBN4004678.1 hypothetical protein [Nostoc sp. LPT]